MLVRSITSAPAEDNRVTAILPRMMFSEKFFEPIEILSPSNDLMSDSGPASSPVRTGPAAVPKPQPESNNPKQARTAVTETDVWRRRDTTQNPLGRLTSPKTTPNP